MQLTVKLVHSFLIQTGTGKKRTVEKTEISLSGDWKPLIPRKSVCVDLGQVSK
jgi:hypothetical protein